MLKIRLQCAGWDLVSWIEHFSHGWSESYRGTHNCNTRDSNISVPPGKRTTYCSHWPNSSSSLVLVAWQWAWQLAYFVMYPSLPFISHPTHIWRSSNWKILESQLRMFRNFISPYRLGLRMTQGTTVSPPYFWPEPSLERRLPFL